MLRLSTLGAVLLLSLLSVRLLASEEPVPERTAFRQEDGLAHKMVTSVVHARDTDRDFNVDPSPASHSLSVLAPQQPWFIALILIALLAVGVTSGYALRRYRRWRGAQARLIQDLESELQKAHDIQMGLLPARPVILKGFELAGRCRPAEHLGGDYFNYFWLDESAGLLGFAAADVAGKAMDAAVRVTQLSGIFGDEFRDRRPLLEVLDGLGRRVLDQLNPAGFVTCCLGQVEVGKACVRLANAGHPYPFHYSASSKEVTLLEMPSLPLGIVLPPEAAGGHSELAIPVSPGDVIVLYSDGVTETHNACGEVYESPRMMSVIRLNAGLDVEKLVDALLEDTLHFMGDAPQSDDITLLVIRALPAT